MLCKYGCGCECGEADSCEMCCPAAVAEREARLAAPAEAAPETPKHRRKKAKE